MAWCQLWVPGLFDKQNVKPFTDNCNLAIMYRYVCRTQGDVTLDTTIPETPPKIPQLWEIVNVTIVL
jgi:hypothetical protein